MTATGYRTHRTRVAMEADERRREGEPRRDKSFGNPLDDMTADVREALGGVKQVGPLFAERVADAEAILAGTMRLEQTTATIANDINRGMDRAAAMRARDRALRDATKDMRGRRMRLAAHVDGLAGVLEGRAFPDPGRGDRSAEVKADAERSLAKVADNPAHLAPAMVELATAALHRGDTAMVSQLTGTFGQTVIRNATANDRDAKELTAEVRGAIFAAAQDAPGALTDTQRAALEQLDQLPDLAAAVDGAVLTASMRFDDVMRRLPWTDDMERGEAERDPDRNPFFQDRLLGG
jgi:hypothetical protein